jgi:hypothetical protein
MNGHYMKDNREFPKNGSVKVMVGCLDGNAGLG